MGLYIKSMEMPKSCYACMFFAQTDYWNKEDEADILSRCKRTGEKTWESVNGYLPNCPLVPVPPHGDLIDRGYAIATACSGRIRTLPTTEDGENWIRVEEVRESIKNAPTIIPASFENPAKNARYSQDNPAEEGE